MFNNVGVFQPDFVVNKLYNTIELTDKGREKLYTFPYFALSDGKVAQSKLQGRIFGDSYGNRFIRGYAIVFHLVKSPIPSRKQRVCGKLN